VREGEIEEEAFDSFRSVWAVCGLNGINDNRADNYRHTICVK
jgi:hypothetical protein